MFIGIDAHNLEGNRTGVGRYLFNLLKIWSKVDFGINLHTLEYVRNRQFKFILYFKDKIPSDLPKSELFINKLLNIGSTAKFIHWDLWRQAKKDKVDILFCPGYIAPIFWKGKLVLTLHDIIYQAHPEWFEWPSWADKILLKWVSKISAKKAKLIFTISEFSRREIIKHYRVAPDKIVLTPLGADPSFLAEASATDHRVIKERHQIKDKFIFFVGSIFERRRLPEIIAAFEKLNRDDYQLMIAGRDYTAGKKVDKLSVTTNQRLGRRAILRVDFLDDNDLKLLYSACAFFVWLSDYEGFGLPVLEAMSLGAPVLTSDNSSLKEVAGEAALLIKNNGDAEKIHQAMKRLIEDEQLRQDFIRKGRAQVKKFSWEKCAEETLKAIISI